MLSSVILNGQVTMTVINSGSQLSEMSTISYISQAMTCLCHGLYIFLCL